MKPSYGKWPPVPEQNPHPPQKTQFEIPFAAILTFDHRVRMRGRTRFDAQLYSRKFRRNLGL
jgi:hypothetical protein